MKKLFLVLLCLLVAFPLFAWDPAEYENPTLKEYSWYIREIPVRTIRFEDGEQIERNYVEYYLFFGNELAEKINYNISASGRMFALYMFKSYNKEEWGDNPLGWQLEFVDSSVNVYHRWPALAEYIWPEIPEIMKHVLKALGPRAPGLVLIYFNPYTKSVSVFYKAKHSENEDFYKAKLRKVQYYFDNLENFEKQIKNPWRGDKL